MISDKILQMIKDIGIDKLVDIVSNNPMQWHYSMYCRMLDADGEKYNLEFPDDLRQSTRESISQFIQNTDNYGSFYFNVFEEGVIIETYRIVN